MKTFPEVVRAGDVLIGQGMPDDEVLAVQSTRDPVVVHRHLELHRERLAERLAEQRAAVDRVERLLVSR